MSINHRVYSDIALLMSVRNGCKDSDMLRRFPAMYRTVLKVRIRL